jgi:hypothetical protein
MRSLNAGIGGRTQQAGTLVAAAVMPITFQPTLMPRSGLDQALITGISTSLNYAFAALIQDSIEAVALRGARRTSSATSTLAGSTSPNSSRELASPTSIARSSGPSSTTLPSARRRARGRGGSPRLPWRAATPRGGGRPAGRRRPGSRSCAAGGRRRARPPPAVPPHFRRRHQGNHARSGGGGVGRHQGGQPHQQVGLPVQRGALQGPRLHPGQGLQDRRLARGECPQAVLGRGVRLDAHGSMEALPGPGRIVRTG